jgi:hypothetical protein
MSGFQRLEGDLRIGFDLFDFRLVGGKAECHILEWLYRREHYSLLAAQNLLVNLLDFWNKTMSWECSWTRSIRKIEAGEAPEGNFSLVEIPVRLADPWCISENISDFSRSTASLYQHMHQRTLTSYIRFLSQDAFW